MTLAAFNIAQIDFSLTYRAFAFSLFLAGILLLALRLVMRNWMKAALLTLFLLILFFSYGHVYNFLKNPVNPFLGLVRHRILGLVWLGWLDWQYGLRTGLKQTWLRSLWRSISWSCYCCIPGFSNWPVRGTETLSCCDNQTIQLPRYSPAAFPSRPGHLLHHIRCVHACR